MIVNRDYRRNIAVKEGKKIERQRTRRRAMLVLGMLVLAVLVSGAVRIARWAGERWRAGNERNVAVAVEKPQAPAEAAPEPKYDFYDILPRQRVEITPEEIREHPVRLPPRMLEEFDDEAGDAPQSLDAALDLASEVGQGEGETPKGYLIQAGAFGDPLKADQMRARIAGLGFAARVEPVQVNGAMLNRVRLGPFTDPQEVEVMRRRLQANDIDIDIINRY